MSRPLPPKPNLKHLKNEAKDLLKAHQRKETSVCNTLRSLHRFSKTSDQEIIKADLSLQEVQHALAMDYGFKNWNDLKMYVEKEEHPRVEFKGAKTMQCENCKKEPATTHTTEMSQRKVEKEVHLCDECLRKTTFGKYRLLPIQCEKCKKPSNIMFQGEISHPNAKPKIVCFCEECIIEVRDRIQCKRCKRKFAPTGDITQCIQEIRSKSPGGIALVPIRCGKCGDRGTYGDSTVDYPE